MPYVLSTLAVVAAVLVGQLLTKLTPLPNLSMIFLLAVLFPAVSFGVRPAICASLLSFLAYNFFFIEPLYTFTIAEPYEFFALVIFLLVAVVTSALAGRARDHARIAANRLETMRRLYEFTRGLSEFATVDSVADRAASELRAVLRREAIFLIHSDGELLRAGTPRSERTSAAGVKWRRLALAVPDFAWLALAAIVLSFFSFSLHERSSGCVRIYDDPARLACYDAALGSRHPAKGAEALGIPDLPGGSGPPQTTRPEPASWFAQHGPSR
jgi:hypothetical protein